jgi:hypothetical protein
MLSGGGLALDIFKHRSAPLDVEIAVHPTEFATIVKISGAPARVSRGPAEIASDGGRFLGVLLQRTGRTVFESGSEQMMVQSGDLLIWHCGRSIRFDMPDHFQKICLLVQRDMFESMLPQANYLRRRASGTTEQYISSSRSLPFHSRRRYDEWRGTHWRGRRTDARHAWRGSNAAQGIK